MKTLQERVEEAIAAGWKPGGRYVTAHDGWFGYQPALTPADRYNGITAAPLTMVKVTEHRGSQWSFMVQDGGGALQIVTCEEPCKTVRVAQTAPGSYGAVTFLQAAPDSIVGAYVEDARMGRLPVPRD